MARNNRERGPVKRNNISWEASPPAKRKAENRDSSIFYINNLEENFKKLLFDPITDLIHQIGDVIDVKSGTGYHLFACVENLPTSPKVDRFFRFRNYLDLQSIGVQMPGIILTQETKLSAVSVKPIMREVPGFSEAEFKEDVAKRPAPSVHRTLKRIHIPTVDVKTATSLPKGQSVLRLKALTREVKDHETSSGKVITLFDPSCKIPLKVLIKEEQRYSIGHIPLEDEVVCLYHFKTHRRENQTTSMLISTEKSSIEIVRDEATLEGFKSIEHGQRVEGEIQESSMETYLACPNRECYFKKVDRVPGPKELWGCIKCDQQYEEDELSEGLRMLITSEGSKGEITEWVMFERSIAPYVRDDMEASELPSEVVGRRFTARRSGNVLNEMNIEKNYSFPSNL